MRITIRFWLAACVLLAPILTRSAEAQRYKYETFSVPYPATSPAQYNWTEALGINNNGAIVGYYSFGSDSPPSPWIARFAFKRHANGTIEYPIKDSDGRYIGGVGLLGSLGDGYARSINNLGDIAGNMGSDGYILAANRQMTRIQLGSKHTILFGINERGDYAGTYDLRPFARIGGVLIDLTPAPDSGWEQPEPHAIGWDGTIVGISGQRGYLRGPNGGELLVVNESDPYFTWLTGINNAAGKIVGWRSSPTGLESFIWDHARDLMPHLISNTALTVPPPVYTIPNSSTQTIAVPGADETKVFSITADGTIVGSAYFRGSGEVKAFIGTPVP